jgi:hypothetical protein
MVIETIALRPYEMTARMICDFILDNRHMFPARNMDGTVRINSTRTWRNFPIVQTLSSRLKADKDFANSQLNKQTKVWAYIGDEQ